jgi:hypothetical protein
MVKLTKLVLQFFSEFRVVVGYVTYFSRYISIQLQQFFLIHRGVSGKNRKQESDDGKCENLVTVITTHIIPFS